MIFNLGLVIEFSVKIIGLPHLRILKQSFKGIVSRDFGTLFLFHWIDLKVVIWPDQVYFSL
jgi:hypothetical protein